MTRFMMAIHKRGRIELSVSDSALSIWAIAPRAFHSGVSLETPCQYNQSVVILWRNEKLEENVLLLVSE